MFPLIYIFMFVCFNAYVYLFMFWLFGHICLALHTLVVVVAVVKFRFM